ncbi:MAG: hypothetical protein U0930_07870 [Pirellulales bacterium]
MNLLSLLRILFHKVAPPVTSGDGRDFLCGCIVGGAITRVIVRYQLQTALKTSDNLASRIAPQLVHSIGLRDEQRDRIQELLQLRYERLESLRAETYPLQLAEFDTLCSEIEAELDERQKSKWENLVAKLKQDCMPPAPISPPATDFLFSNFDSNRDGQLEQSELPGRMWFHVRNADADGDGLVSKSEFEAARSLRTQQAGSE